MTEGAVISAVGKIDHLNDIAITEVAKDRLKEAMPCEPVVLTCLYSLCHFR
jgi:hypothetical protein